MIHQIAPLIERKRSIFTKIRSDLWSRVQTSQQIDQMWIARPQFEYTSQKYFQTPPNNSFP